MNFEDYYLHTFLPAESFFQTVLMNTSFNDLIVNDDKRAVIEKPIFGKKQTPDELILFLKATNHLFIRKINEKTEEEVVKYIEESYDLPLPNIDEVERELKIDKRQDN
jgi:predicted RNA-binding protein